MKNINKVALIYTRVSSSKQELEGTGNKSQETRCRELAKNENLEVEKVFTDVYSGGGGLLEETCYERLTELS